MKYKVGDKVRIKSIDWYNENKNEDGDIPLINKPNNTYNFIKEMQVLCGKVMTISNIKSGYYDMLEDDGEYFWTDKMIEGLVEEDMGEVSDGYHTFNELYEYRLLYNASFFNELAKQNLYDVHKSKKHSDGEECFGGGQFIVMAELPTGQISNHYELKDWDLFQVPEKEKANKWDGHTPQDVAKRMREFVTPKPNYPKTYEECAKILLDRASIRNDLGYKGELLVTLQKLLVCRDAYWKIAGEEMGLGKPWKSDWEDESDKFTIEYFYNNINTDTIRNYESHLLAFPTKEMRDAFYENFKDLIEQCKELL